MIVFISDLWSDHPEIYWIAGLHVIIGHTINLTYRYAMSSNCHALLLTLFLLLPCDTFSKGDTPHFEEEALEAKCPRWWPQYPHRATSKTRVAVQQVWLKLFDYRWLQGGPNQPKLVSRWSECEGCLWAGEMGSGSCWNRNITINLHATEIRDKVDSCQLCKIEAPRRAQLLQSVNEGPP